MHIESTVLGRKTGGPPPLPTRACLTQLLRDWNWRYLSSSSATFTDMLSTCLGGSKADAPEPLSRGSAPGSAGLSAADDVDALGTENMPSADPAEEEVERADDIRKVQRAISVEVREREIGLVTRRPVAAG